MQFFNIIKGERTNTNCSIIAYLVSKIWIFRCVSKIFHTLIQVTAFNSIIWIKSVPFIISLYIKIVFFIFVFKIFYIINKKH